MSGQLQASTTLPSETASSTVRLERLHGQSGPFGDEKILTLPGVEIC